MPRWKSALLVGTIVALIVALPFVVFRADWAHSKRLREIEPGRVYRSGQMTAEGFTDAVREYRIRTVLNLQEDNQDPLLPLSFLDGRTIHESELCARIGVRYRLICPDLINPRRADAGARPPTVDEFLEVMDDPDSYPILFHCKAGLHRTGCLAAVYRMEYHGWTQREAYEELKAHGFGDPACTAANEYVRQYVLNYQPGQRRPLRQAKAGE
jgi:tyrosine-protein phosphatase SIW14